MSLFPFLTAFGLPMVLALSLTVPQGRALVWRMIPFAPLPALALALLAELPLNAQADWLILGLHLGLNDVSRLFVIFTGLLWCAAGASARHWMRDDPRATSFGVMFLLAQTGNLGLLLAQDALSFYAFFALMSFASYGLVLHNREAQAQGAARLYISFVILGELALFAGLALGAAQAGSFLLADLRGTELPDMAVSLLIVGFGVKLGIMPLHFWLPPAHGAAPVPASAVLSGAMIKAGLFGMMAVLPLGNVAYADHGTVLMAAGMVTIFAALLLGVQQSNPKATLGYSSVSQMGIMALGLGAGLMVPAAWAAILPVLVFLAAHHALAKGALFLGTGAFAAQSGFAGKLAVTLALLLPACVLAGVPASSGSLGKEALKAALAAGSSVWLPWLRVALTLSGVATTLLMARYVALLWLHPPKTPHPITPEGVLLPFLALAAASLGLPLVWPLLAQTLASPILEGASGAFWPVALGGALASGVAVYAYAQRIGPALFVSHLTAPFRAFGARVGSIMTARRRAARRLGHAVPKALGSTATSWRLGQTAIAGLIALTLTVEMRASLHLEAAIPPAPQQGQPSSQAP
ncbi:formate hydrogenlyase subunit 3/multisubunit Na+/H+ antiporter MnhD subunit [Roseinatronobacter thiooxidans]|uniref:Formate hydrogenlyase subunit 3/multisubunit Na+/H+ antiporter MnhD subunit n=1 Tax=Roseinatronobacter thiooxidans TaxID=121821 RepID=A0A2W7QM69_9RHOB|nr:complex I subunit 5 family protein [Roseinatronobacter thiooxidans]PZX39525.1 formate hydrogenlyase subunit 3/multisubunit Na+/H+ antiporter MnhD subunit [Roseinatronobacter thiooxidans]